MAHILFLGNIRLKAIVLFMRDDLFFHALTIGESQTISHANETEQQTQEPRI